MTRRKWLSPELDQIIALKAAGLAWTPGPGHTSAPVNMQPMLSTLKAGFVYVALVLGTGFRLGVPRVPFLVPRIGERWAELVEMPIMAGTIYFSAGHILRRFPAVDRPSIALVVGALALVLSICAELALAVTRQSQSITQYLASRDKVSGSVYLIVLVLFALMPRLRLHSSE